MNSTFYQIFVCSKQRHPDSSEGCCHNCGAAEIYTKFQTELKQHNLDDQVKLQYSSCLDRCESGPVVLICQPPKRELFWLPLKIRIKLKKLFFSNRYFYGGFTVEDVPQMVKSHLLKRRPLKQFEI